MSKGQIVIPESIDVKSVLAQQMFNDLKLVWQLTQNEIEGDIFWATDPSLNTVVPKDNLDNYFKKPGIGVTYLSPGNIEIPKPLKMPCFGVEMYIPGLMLGSKGLAPMVVFSHAKEISETSLQDYNLERIVAKEREETEVALDYEKGESFRKVVKPEKWIDKKPKYSNLDGLLQEMGVSEAYVVEVGVFLPMAGEGKSYETEFLPVAYCFNSDFQFQIVVDKTIIGHQWVNEKGKYQDLEDIRDPDNPRRYKAEHNPLSLDSQPANLDDTKNQMIIVAQSGSLPREERFIYCGGWGGGDGKNLFKASEPTLGFSVSVPKIVYGSKTGTKTRTVEFNSGSSPAVVYHLHVFGVTPFDIRRTINPQRFSDFVRPLMK